MTNRNAIIVNRTDKTGKIRTETKRRDVGATNFSVSTDVRNNSSKLFIDLGSGDTVTLSGREIQTLCRVLDKHFANI